VELGDFGAYPVDHVVSAVNALLATDGVCIVVAPPGTGKTTRLPLLLDPSNRVGRLIMTEPRRAAARSAAQRLASTLGERIGETVGLRMRNDTRVSAATQIEVVTEGVFLRMLRSDVGLTGIGAVVFDEVHERRLDCDLSMALSLYARELVRPDLQVVAMSATLDTEATAKLLRAQIIKVDSTLFDVTISYRPTIQAELDRGAVAAIDELLRTTTGDILVFLPGSCEIRATTRQLERHLASSVYASETGREGQGPQGPHGPDGRQVRIVVTPLLGTSSPDETRIALEASKPGTRKIVLATAVAQTSLTIPGVRSVVDSGLTRRAAYDDRSGVSRLVTERSSQATAIQRAGRAGREGPGHVVRLWSKAEYHRCALSDPPEISSADLAETVLALASWGVADPSDLRWIDPPKTERWTTAVGLLQSLALLDSEGRLTSLGESVGELPAHPRVQAMLAYVREHGDSASCVRAASLAADLSGADELRSIFATFLAGRDSKSKHTSSLSLGLISALVCPDRIAARIGSDPGRYQFGAGGIGTLGPDDPVRGTPFLVAVELDGDSKGGRIFRSVPVTVEEVKRVLLNPEEHRITAINDSGNVEVIVEQRVGALCLERRYRDPSPSDVAEAALAAIDLTGELGGDSVRTLFVRREIAASQQCSPPAARGPDTADGEWPSWEGERLHQLLRAACSSLPAKQPLGHFNLAEILRQSLSYRQQQLLNEFAPMEVSVASGRTLRVDYLADGGPTVRSRLQDFLGQHDNPRIALGTVPLRLELLSPAQRPAAITSDLRNFWLSGYRAVRADLRHRYPKHDWPENPLDISVTPNESNGKLPQTPKRHEPGPRR
jgi:ATP-dependent helicase HrpB